MITDMKKSCPGNIRLNKKHFAAFEANFLNVLKAHHAERSPAQEMDPHSALSLQLSSTPGDPPQLQLP